MATRSQVKRQYYTRMTTRYPARPITIKRQRELPAIVRQLVSGATDRNVKLSLVDLCDQLDLGYLQVKTLCSPLAMLPAQHAAVDAKVEAAVLQFIAQHPFATIPEVVKHFNRNTQMKLYYGKVLAIAHRANKKYETEAEVEQMAKEN